MRLIDINLLSKKAHINHTKKINVYISVRAVILLLNKLLHLTKNNYAKRKNSIYIYMYKPVIVGESGGKNRSVKTSVAPAEH